MRTRLLFLLLLVFSSPFHGSESSSEKYPKLSKKIKGADKHEGFLDLYSKDGELYALIPRDFLGEEFFYFSSLSRGNYGGILAPAMMLEQEIYYFEKNENKIGLFRRDLYHHVEEEGPQKAAVAKAYPPSLVQGLSIVAASPDEKDYLVRIDPFLFSRGAHILPSWLLQFLGIQGVESSLSHITRVRNFKDNMEIEIQSTLKLHPYLKAMSQANQFRLLFSFVRKEKSDYKSRAADDRIGYFTVDRRDFSAPDLEDGEHRMITRWNVSKAREGKRSSIVKKPITFYLDPTIPHSYRQFVRAGILEWNLAFEKLGFIGALEARQVHSEEGWDPLDIEKSTISWTADTSAWAIGPSRINPETGEILDADLIVSSGWISFIEKEADLISVPLKKVFESGFEDVPRREKEFALWLQKKSKNLEKYMIHANFCSYPMHLHDGKDLALLSTAASSPLTGEALEEWKRNFIGIYLKNIVMHEVGHALGLRHNFKASSTVPYQDLLNPAINRTRQPSSSVMDYNDVFVANNPELQGKYINDSLGEYDVLAIEYGYSEIPSKEEESVLDEIASSLKEKGLAYATDEDLWFSQDPMIDTGDLGDDLPRAAHERLLVFEKVLEGMEGKLLKKGDRYDLVRRILFRVLNEYLFKSLQIFRVIGGVSTTRVHVRDSQEELPYSPVSVDKQKDALRYLRTRIFSKDFLKVPPRILTMARRNPWEMGSGSPTSMRWVHRVLQMLSILYVLDGDVLGRIRSFHEKVGSSSLSAVSILEEFDSFLFSSWRAGESLPDVTIASFYITHLGVYLQENSKVPQSVKIRALSLIYSLRDWFKGILKKSSEKSAVYRIHAEKQQDFQENEEKIAARFLLTKISQILNTKMVQRN